jgi:hypothetical protein
MSVDDSKATFCTAQIAWRMRKNPRSTVSTFSYQCHHHPLRNVSLTDASFIAQSLLRAGLPNANVVVRKGSLSCRV